MQLSSTTAKTDFGTGAAWLAAAVFLYIWISLTPFKDLSYVPPALTADLPSNVLNQVISIAAFAAMLTFGLRKDLRPLVLRPFFLLAGLALWIAFATVIGPQGFGGLRRVVLATMLIGMASIFLLLLRDERQLGGVLIACASVVLGLCYLGVIFTPWLSIHQAGDYMEPLLAGDWRGLFDHKNGAAPAMVLLAFAGLYISRARSGAAGWAIFILAAFFLFKSGGKTAMALLPATLVLAWLIERGNLFWRTVIVLGVVGGYSTLTVGSVMLPPLRKFVEALGIDPTFTGRTDIWELAISGIQSSPLFGYGYGGFWRTGGLVYTFREEATWAISAPTAHNSYVDILLAGGVIAMALMMIWIVLLPLRDLTRTIERSGPTPLTRLFTRIWIFCLILAGMELIFLTTNDTAWFSMMIAVFGLRLEAQAHRRAATTAGAGPARRSMVPA